MAAAAETTCSRPVTLALARVPPLNLASTSSPRAAPGALGSSTAPGTPPTTYGRSPRAPQRAGCPRRSKPTPWKMLSLAASPPRTTMATLTAPPSEVRASSTITLISRSASVLMCTLALPLTSGQRSNLPPRLSSSPRRHLTIQRSALVPPLQSPLSWSQSSSRLGVSALLVLSRLASSLHPTLRVLDSARVLWSCTSCQRASTERGSWHHPARPPSQTSRSLPSPPSSWLRQGQPLSTATPVRCTQPVAHPHSVLPSTRSGRPSPRCSLSSHAMHRPRWSPPPLLQPHCSMISSRRESVPSKSRASPSLDVS